MWCLLPARRRRACCAIGAVFALLAPPVASAAPTGGLPGLPLLKLAFHSVGIADTVMSNQRYAFAAPAQLAGSGSLFDDQSNRRVNIPLGGCEPIGGDETSYPVSPSVSGDVLALDCMPPLLEPQVRLYSIASGSWQVVPLNSEITACEAYMGVCSSALISAGTNWLGFAQSSCETDEHCVSEDVFQNIRTGQVVNDPAVARGDQIGNVDAPQIAQRLCSPLTVPVSFNNTYRPPGPGFVEPDGRFAVASSIGPQGGSKTYLYECGTHREQLLKAYGPAQQANPMADNAHAVVWQASYTSLTVEFLPSRRRYQVPLPERAQGDVQPALTDKHLYLLVNSEAPDGNGRLWVGNFPAKPPASRSHSRG